MTLRETRKSKGITQKAAAAFLGVPLRTYSNYENDPKKQNTIKYRYMLEKLNSYGYIDEETGILSLEMITEVCSSIFPQYGVEYCYLFGSYAKGTASETSDVDLLVYTELSGISFFGLVEELREKLKKKVDVLDQKQIVNNFALVNEILKDGIKIYG
ncbi:MAG: nucleotidyltransferase domain-containing protein [Clostridia bacterium]|nr:nucleotidyltransferase domain-containing protein [Clostridia bacterium]